MRPLRLQVKGFTAFRDEQELDFTDFDVFAIAGPTGSGKSSLLDAMTYALYGRVERVGDRVGQLISQGQPRMAVTLEFVVGHDRYRVTRSTPAKGRSKILLERQSPGGEWVQAGEGADRVREAEPMIVRAIGLTYDGFTRSVLLPQGRFAEFLVGDPRKRRDILTELLGLSLFRRMAERAGAIAKESGDRANWTTDMLEREFADATPEALREAKQAVKNEEKREKALAVAAQRMVEILGRWQEARRSVDELRACAEEAARAAASVSEATRQVSDLAVRMVDAVTAVGQAAAESKASEEELDRTRFLLRNAEETIGPADDLANALIRASALAEATRARETRGRQRRRVTEEGAALREALQEAESALAERREGFARQEAETRRAEAALDEARHADLLDAVSAGLKAGDLCPVCGLRLETAPKKAAAGAVERAQEGADGARRVLEAARRHLSEAERAADAARRDVETNAAEQTRLADEVDEFDQAISGHRASLEAALGVPLPRDPARALDERLAELRRLDTAERHAARAVADATQALLKAERDRDRAGAAIDRLRDRLAADHQPLFDRAARALGEKPALVGLHQPPDASKPEALARYGEGLVRALESFADRIGEAVEERLSLEDRLLMEAHEQVGGIVEPAATLGALAESVNAACRRGTAEVATTAQRAEDLAERLDRKKQLAQEARRLEDRARLFRSLAMELRADRLIAFLHEEALEVLAAAGSVRLASLSEGRYRIVCREDEFFVVDTWNGDEERSVRTLSGGETFLASLALALALSEQVRSLSVTERAGLDSLFLDEGFGTLDPDTLRVVVDAIEELGGDGRLVAVITHVRELAEQFPRIEVTKSPRGSRLALAG
jgi:exonuclease SbcC